MRFEAKLLAVAGFAAFAAAAPAGAHPHVFIDNVATFVFKDGKLAAIRLRWTFDEVFSASIVAEFDRDRDGKFDAAESKALEEGAFANLREFGYFTHLALGGKSAPVREVSGFAASVENKMLVYRFTVTLAAPVDPRQTAVALGVYDESYFVDVEAWGKNTVRFEGNEAMPCRVVFAENPRKAYYNGAIIPVELNLKCGPE